MADHDDPPAPEKSALEKLLEKLALEEREILGAEGEAARRPEDADAVREFVDARVRGSRRGRGGCQLWLVAALLIGLCSRGAGSESSRNAPRGDRPGSSLGCACSEERPAMTADEGVELYAASYGNFASQLSAEIRRAAFGEDIGQTSWITAEEQDRFLGWLALGRDSRLLDVACGSGGPTLRIARQSGAEIVGVDLHPQGIAEAREQARASGSERVRFEVLDAGEPLPFGEASFDALVCIDAINHLPERARVLADWRRVLVPGGRLVFTDPVVVTGPISGREMRLRSSIGEFLFVPPGIDEQLLEGAGFQVERAEDHSENMAETARRWLEARGAREVELRRLEGDSTYEGQQRFLEVTSRLARERRLARLAFLAVAH